MLSCCGGCVHRLDPIEIFDDGSYLAKIYQIRNYKRRGEGLVVRVIDYRIDDGRDNDDTYRLFTTICDPSRATAEPEPATLTPTVGDRIGLR